MRTRAALPWCLIRSEQIDVPGDQLSQCANLRQTLPQQVNRAGGRFSPTARGGGRLRPSRELSPGCCPHLRLRVRDQPHKRQLNHFAHVDLNLDLDVDVDVDVLIRDTFSRAS